MTINYCKPLPGREMDVGLTNDMSAKRRWLVQTNTRYYYEGQLLADAIAFGANPPVPTPFLSTHPNDIRLLCKRLRGRQETNSPLHWIVEADYDSKPWDTRRDEDQPPTARRALITWSTVKYQKAVEKDRDGDAVLNSAGHYFDPPPLKDISRWTATVSKNLSYIPTDILDYTDKINSATWIIDGVTVAPNVAKIMGISISESKNEMNEDYRTLQYTVEFDPVFNWAGVYLNQGFYNAAGERIKDDSSPTPKDCIYPWPLGLTGNKITNPTPATATFQVVYIYSEMDFSVLPVT